MMNQYIRPAMTLYVMMTLLTGICYPLLTTAIGQTFLPSQVNGSLIRHSDNIVGSKLIGQNFTGPQYFWGRPSATGPYPNNASASSGSNLGPLNPALSDAIKARIDTLQKADPDNKLTIPVDLVTASASGLDPEISPAAAMYQVDRVARTRGLPAEQVLKLVDQHTQQRQFGVLGEPRVNVLELNLALDDLKKDDLKKTISFYTK